MPIELKKALYVLVYRRTGGKLKIFRALWRGKPGDKRKQENKPQKSSQHKNYLPPPMKAQFFSFILYP